MKKLLKAPNNLVRRVLSKTSQTSHECKSEKDEKKLMSEEQKLAEEIQSLKSQIERLRAAINALKEEADRKEVAVANIAREKEKITLELLKQKRSNGNLLRQLDDERKFYCQEKEQYCHEMTQFKRLKQVLSNAAANKDENMLSVEYYKKEIEKIKQTLNQTLEANYNLSIKFLRMKNTKTCLKTELKTMQLEHEKLVKDYKAQILSLSQELNNLIQERLNTPISGSSKKYLHLVKQNSCLVYENLCLQLEVDNLHLKCEKLQIEKTKSETNSRLKYIKHDHKTPKKSTEKQHKRVRIKEEQPEKLERDVSNMPSTSRFRPEETKNCPDNNEILKIFERHQLPGIPDIRILNDFDTPSTSKFGENYPPQIPSVQEKPIHNDLHYKLKTVTEKPSSKLALFQVSNVSSRTSTAKGSGLVRVHSSPDLQKANFNC